MVDALNDFFGQISGFLWGNFYMIVLVGTGLYFSIRLGFPQIRRLGDSFRLVFSGMRQKNKAGKEGMSTWQSLATAIAGQVGTGNIAGPATAIMAGGPGAIFWMWVSAFLGMSTIFSEAVAAQKYKVTLEDGRVNGGPAYYIKAAFKGKLGSGLANAFSIFLIIGFGLAAALLQGNTISESFAASFNIPPIAIGIVMSILTLLVVVGGVQRIASFVTACVPVMSLIYIVAGLIVIVVNIDQLIPAIFTEENSTGHLLQTEISQIQYRENFSTHWIIWNISEVHTVFLIQQLIFVQSIPGILLSLQSYAKMQRRNSSESITSAIRIRLHGSTKMTAYTLILSQDMRWKLKVL